MGGLFQSLAMSSMDDTKRFKFLNQIYSKSYKKAITKTKFIGQ